MVGEKALIYVYPNQFNVFNNFWYTSSVYNLYNISHSTNPHQINVWFMIESYYKSDIWQKNISYFSLRLTLENCKVCKESDCTGDSVEIIQNACSDSTQEGFQTDFSKKTVLANQIATKMSSANHRPA